MGTDNPTTIPFKRCTKCNREFLATPEYFQRNGAGLRPDCKACSAARKAGRREEIRVYNVAYRASHSEEARAYSAEYYADNKEKLCAYSATYRAVNPDKTRASNAAWSKAHPEENRAKGHRHRALERALPCQWTVQDEQRAINYFGGLCAYCDKQSVSLFAPCHLDHFIPLSDIDNCPGTVPTNMLPTCRQCNSSKRDKQPKEWLARKFGKRKAAKILARIESYFASLKEGA